MGKKSKKTKRKSELKIIFFIILVAAALFIVSTYAWFSTQRNVSITNLNGAVQVAEGLEISLDAENWANEIVLGSGEGQLDIIEDAYDGHRNLSPTELLPLSTLGLVGENMSDLQLLRGKVTNTKQLSGIVEASHDDTITDREDLKFAGHFAFDVFLKNSSKMTQEVDELQLNYDSTVHIMANEEGTDKSNTGLQNTVRVAFAKFGGTKDGGGNVTGVAEVSEDDPLEILRLTGATGSDADDVYITDVAIWEPNAATHVDYIVKNNNNITWNPADSISPTTTGAKGEKLFTAKTKMPTYALKPAAIGKEIADLYNWDGQVNKDVLAKQITLQTTVDPDKAGDKVGTFNDEVYEGVQNLISTSSPNVTEAGAVKFTIPANTICRLRVYVWLEGQDVDCINYASHGGGITVNIGLVKGSDIGSHGEASENT